MARTTYDLKRLKQDMQAVLSEKIIPFWLDRSVDETHGGYFTSFDKDGVFDGNDGKYIVTQCRMLWGFSNLLPFARKEDRGAVEHAANIGARFLMRKFWDQELGGFYWRLNRDGTAFDTAKLVYGESFALYALSEYFLNYGDEAALSMACETFELLQVYAADTRFGGYYENLERDWSPSLAGPCVGDRKSLDIHMHLLESFTTLYQASGKEIHRRKLMEVLDLIMDHMVNRDAGYGYNQFDLCFHKLPAINIPRTWNAERETNEKVDTPTDTTSYGHNVELSWLASLAVETMKEQREKYDPVMKKLLDHSLMFGYDYTYGGVYRDGIADRQVLVTDKEWWQNFEAMTGYLNGYVCYRDEKYLEAFFLTWTFIKEKFLHETLGESRQLLDRRGNVLVGNLGNPWKGIYHTGRALAECIKRLELMESMDSKKQAGKE